MLVGDSRLFGTATPARRPVLLTLVFGAFLAIVGITAAGQSTIIASNFTAVTLQAIVSGDAAAVEAFAGEHLRAADLVPGSVVGQARRAALDAGLSRITARGDLLGMAVHRADGTLLATGGPTATLVEAPPSGGRPEATILTGTDAGALAGDPGLASILRERLPIRDTTGRDVAVATVLRDAAPILARLDDISRQVIVVTLSAAMLASGLLLLIFRSAQRRLTRQTRELVESTRRDPLTGTLNHGALVSLLADRIEVAREGGAPVGGAIGIALVDLDNFTLLNDHHGHAVGDVALAAVLDELRVTAPPDAVIGRYGPDEFLVIVREDDIAALEPSIRALRDRLVDRALEVDAPDRLPITVSAGIAAYPKDGSSLTVLLATVAATLGTAKASGGDDVRVAGAEDTDATATSSFDVLQGLVFAVDTKDRYTKRHSEDVARYAVFLARQLGLDDATVATIRVAGLLHDIGKIGIPDLVLRKPGKLTDEEYEIVKQHVVLGDMIVRDLPDIELVRAGIRGHHERWDGRGYVDRLSGDEIPLAARILSVGDAFSAMTTSRPYRRALDIREAIRRLEDAAGTQLDATLVTAFVHGLETVPDAPMPGRESIGTLWTPGAVA